MGTEYKKKWGISRTVLRPVLKKEPIGLTDRQALPPYSWCQRCGGEIYQMGKGLCLDCDENKTVNGGTENEQ